MIYYVVNGVAFDAKEEAQETAEALDAQVQPVQAPNELQAICIAQALNDVDGSVTNRNNQKRNSSAFPPPD